jgi:hypothetical protein
MQVVCEMPVYLQAEQPKPHYFCQVKAAIRVVHWLTQRI